MNTTFLLIILSTINQLGFFMENDITPQDQNTTILGMVLLEEPKTLNIDGVIKELEKEYNLVISSKEIGEGASVLQIQGYNIAIANIPAPIPGDEVKTTAAYNYIWQNGENEATKHKGHIVLSIMNAGKNPVDENILYNQLAAAILKNSKSIGIYIGGRTLLLEKEFYLSNSESISKDNLPLYNWIYFGLRQDNGKQSIYTYGLADFGKKEMEIINSSKSLEDLSEIMYNMTHYVLANDVILNDGETIGMSVDQKLKMTVSKGKYVQGRTLKIEY